MTPKEMPSIDQAGLHTGDQVVTSVLVWSLGCEYWDSPITQRLVLFLYGSLVLGLLGSYFPLCVDCQKSQVEFVVSVLQVY